MSFQVPNRSAVYTDAMARVYSSDWAIRQAADDGYHVVSGCAISASATSGKLDMAVGIAFNATTELVVTAQTAISTTITSLADATNPKWVLVELDTSQVVQFNSGTASSSPEPPTPTASRVVLAALYVPANATTVDALLSTSNSKAKIIDKRVVRRAPVRLIGTDTAQTSLTNPTSLTSLLGATLSIPKNSLTVGDTFVVEGAFTWTNNASSSTIRMNGLFAGINVFNLTSGSIATSATARTASFRGVATVQAVGSGTSAKLLAKGDMDLDTTALSTVVQERDQNTNLSSGFDSTADQVIDLKTLYGTSSSGATISLRQFSVMKFPAP